LLCNRFPFLANEIFNCEINSLLDKFFDAPEHAPKKVEEETTPQAAAAAETEDEEMQAEDKVSLSL